MPTHMLFFADANGIAFSVPAMADGSVVLSLDDMTNGRAELLRTYLDREQAGTVQSALVTRQLFDWMMTWGTPPAVAIEVNNGGREVCVAASRPDMLVLVRQHGGDVQTPEWQTPHDTADARANAIHHLFGPPPAAS